MCMRARIPWMSGACVEQKRTDPLELEVQAILSHRLGAGNWTWAFCKNDAFLTDELLFQPQLYSFNDLAFIPVSVFCT